MYKRINYKKTKHDGVLISTKRFKSNKGGIYEVQLDCNNMTYKIRNVRRSLIIKSTEKDNISRPKHLNTLKKQAKKALASLGVNFNIEIRSV